MKTLLILALALTGCPRGTFGPPPVDDVVLVMPSATGDGGSPEHRACGVLVDLNCKEGSSPKCEEAFRSAPASHVAAFDVDCVLASRSRSQVKLCGVRCAL